MSAVEKPVIMTETDFQMDKDQLIPVSEYPADVDQFLLNTQMENTSLDTIFLDQSQLALIGQTKVKMEPGTDAFDFAKAAMTNGFNDDDRQLTSQILSSIRKRFFPDVNTDSGLSNVHFNNGSVYNQGEKFRKCDMKYTPSFHQLDNTTEFPNHENIPASSATRLSTDSISSGSASYMSQRSSPDSSSGSMSYSHDNNASVSHCGSPSNSQHNLQYSSHVGSSQDFVSTTQNCTDDIKSEKQNGSKKGQPKSRHLLPPCRVCGDNASGFHYGANTCEACKGFFRRSLKKEVIEYKCIADDNCVIKKGRRNNCPLCRYNKCLSIGMSKEAIKTGRYTHEKRTQDIVEVKQLKGDPLMSDMPLLTIKSEPKSRHSSQSSMSKENRDIIDSIYMAHKATFLLWHKHLDSGVIPGRIKAFAEAMKTKEAVKSQTKSETELTDTSKHADASGPIKNMMINKITKHLEVTIMGFVKFAKGIPGFTGLPLNDQATLIKTSRFEMWMMLAHRFIDCELKIMSGPLGNTHHIDDMYVVFDKEYTDNLFSFSGTLQELKLSKEETALLQSVVLTFSDRNELQESDKVEAIQLQLVSCLEDLVNNSRRFSKIMDTLVRLRDLTEMNNKISEQILLKWSQIQQHPLLFEILSI